MKRAILLGAVMLASCSDATLESHGRLPKLVEGLEPFGIAPTVADTAVATLAYQPPSPECPHVVRIEVHNEPDLMHEPD
ncbi:MAG: hypothetical protein KUG77_06455, partial [Nannocystaceae bacterium]|nr:hypothetical protein [Nannocystaceae bacterium]